MIEILTDRFEISDNLVEANIEQGGQAHLPSTALVKLVHGKVEDPKNVISDDVASCCSESVNNLARTETLLTVCPAGVDCVT